MKHLSVLALLPFLLLAFAPLRATPATQATAVRDELRAVQAEWDRARTSFDRPTFERMLAPDFFVRMGSQRMTRDEFLAEISRQRPGLRLARFESTLLTLAQEDGAWTGVVLEKLEVEMDHPDGTPRKACSLWVTKDRFRKDGDDWRILSSEALGQESWAAGEPPPFDDWSD